MAGPWRTPGNHPSLSSMGHWKSFGVEAAILGLLIIDVENPEFEAQSLWMPGLFKVPKKGVWTFQRLVQIFVQIQTQPPASGGNLFKNEPFRTVLAFWPDINQAFPRIIKGSCHFMAAYAWRRSN